METVELIVRWILPVWVTCLGLLAWNTLKHWKI